MRSPWSVIGPQHSSSAAGPDKHTIDNARRCLRFKFLTGSRCIRLSIKAAAQIRTVLHRDLDTRRVFAAGDVCALSGEASPYLTDADLEKIGVCSDIGAKFSLRSSSSQVRLHRNKKSGTAEENPTMLPSAVR